MSLRTAMMDEIMEQGELLQEIFENRKEITKNVCETLQRTAV